MSTIETVSQRLSWAFPDEEKRSFKAAIIIVNVNRLIPASYIYPLPPPSTSEERLDFICFILKKETGLIYTRNEVLVAHNVLMGHRDTQEQLNFSCDIAKIQDHLNEYKSLQLQSAFAKTFSPIILFPHRTTCSLCDKQLKIIFQACAYIIYCTKIEPCLLYKADCHQCRRSYRISSIYATDRKETIVTSESQKVECIHYSGSLVFSKEFLVSFSCQLIDNYVTFDAFAASTVKTINKLHSNNADVITSDNLARSLEAVWLYYELTNFVFMTSKSTEISYPCAMSEGRTKIKGNQSLRAIFIERNLNWIYHVFTVFWSRHQDIFGSCKCGNCSQVIILDGHQKPRRLVCKYDNVTSLINADELGPLNRGCPYPPRRRKLDNRQPNDAGHYYCDHHRMTCNEEQSVESKLSDEELNNYLKYLKNFDQEESQCNIGRNDMEERFESKKRSMGFIASFLNCGIIVGFSDAINHEGPRKITDHLLTMIKIGAKLPILLVYDAACQLHKFWNFRFNTQHMQKTIYTQELMNMKLVTDRFHNTVHKGKLCKTLFNPDSEQNKIDFIGINTSIAEQMFSYLAKFKIALGSFSYPTSALFTILLFHLKNCDKVNQNPFQQGVIIGSSLETIIQDQTSSQTYCVFETLIIENGYSENDDSQIDDTYVDLSDRDDNP
ncbi:unnamed protein product [Rotaria magnacalcarata]|uniref:Uncharacterized protein n=1 Tax=Rotaria magnacalcarata TaxID=392030 RepID=A0A819RKA5_9BILA|nr:unnamed protein product [Rotaria magnacalcarata]CAF4043430.1 unnamed protein product [Rotaria magnacalcarata]